MMDKAQIASSSSSSEETKASDEVAFHDVYREMRSLEGEVLPTAKSTTWPQMAAAQSHKVS